jgi:DNA-binding CsgD family transcriptional regulator
VRLLERESQLEALAQYAAEARTGQGRLVLIAGEAGVGKSSVLEQLDSSLHDTRWCSGACDGLFTPRPLAPLLDVAGALGGDLEQLCRSAAPRDELFAALLHELGRADQLTVLAIEDVHWADETTLDLLKFLGRRVRAVRALVLVTYRDEGLAADEPLRVTLGELTTQRATRRLDLPPLSAQAVAELAGEYGLAPDEVYRLTAGNPFFVRELLEQPAGQLPTSARDAVLAHVARASAQARHTLEVAALIGTRVEPTLLDAVSGASPATVDELVSRGLLVGEDGRLRFRHEIARLAVDRSIGVHRRPAIHRRILDALLTSGCDDDARLAFHAEAADDADIVLAHAPAAARRAAELAAHREAVAQYERAIRFADRADVRSRGGLYDALAYECSLIDRWQDSADARQAALVLWRQAGDRLREGDTLRFLSRTLWRLCRGAEVREASERAVEILEPLGSTPELAWAYTNLAFLHAAGSDNAVAADLAGRALALAEELDLPAVVSDALNTKACAMTEADDCLAVLRRALDVAVAAGVQEQAGRAYANLYALLCDELRFAEAERFYVDGIAYCDEHDIATFGVCLRGQRANALLRTGRWAEATTLASQLVDRISASLVNRLNPLLSLGTAQARRGDPGAWVSLDEMATLADGVSEPGWVGLARLARAEAAWLERDEVRAGAEIRLALQVAPQCSDLQRSEIAAWHHRITSEAVLGELAEPFASQIAGEPVRAAKIWDELGSPYDAALALLDSTDERHLREALARLEVLGATPAARIARRRMRELGVRSVPAGARAATREHPAGLTRREGEVLVLVCEGRTNDEIAERLFISAKTVDHHVSALLGKLNVPSRRAAAREAVRLGLVGAAG